MDELVYEELMCRHLPADLYRHCLGVAHTASELARRWGADTGKARLAGLVHDYAKIYSPEELLRRADEMGLSLDRVTRAESKLLHAPVGAALLRRDLHITDEQVLQAVAYHTTGCRRMSLLNKIVYLADFIEPNRTFPGVDELRKIASENLGKALLIAVERTIDRVLARGMLLHPSSAEFRNSLLLEMRGERWGED